MVSIIIPIYNGEKYCVRCLDSLINQSYKNIEIICINDKSTDMSEEIIQEYASKDKRVQLINNKNNLGPAQTRNEGLKYATGKYILFLDCDDWLDLNCLEKAIEKFKANKNIDIVLWGIKTAFSYNKINPRYEYLYNNILTGAMALELLSHTIENEFFLSPLLGCKLFKKRLIDSYKISFPDTIYEDDMFSYLAFLYAKEVGLITESYLYYYQHPCSLTHHFSDKNIDDFFITFQLLYKYIDNEQKKNYYRYLKRSLNAMIDNMINMVSDIELQNYYKTSIFTHFYENINISEYYSYVSSITI